MFDSFCFYVIICSDISMCYCLGRGRLYFLIVGLPVYLYSDMFEIRLENHLGPVVQN